MKNAIKNLILLYGKTALYKTINIDDKEIKIVNMDKDEIEIEITEIKYGNKITTKEIIYL